MKKIKFSSKLSFSHNDYKATIRNLLRQIGNDKANYLLSHIESGIMPDFSIDPSAFTDPSSYYEHKQTICLVSKNPVFDWGIDKESVALSRALAAEEQCKGTNIRFTKILNGSIRCQSGEYDLIHSTRFFLKEILGKYDDTFLNIAFGPGATSSLKGSFTNLVCKLGKLPEVTGHGHDYILKSLLTHMPHYSISCGLVERTRYNVRLTTRHLPVQNHDTISFVPKDSKTDRAIFIGPMGNTMIQKGQGSLIRRRMKNYGYDLNTRAELHGEYSRIGSIDGSIATIDLANASDTIASEVVKTLLPEDWYDALDCTRVKFSDYGSGVPVRNEKFSAMGNGFTWELESAIFLAIGLAVRYLSNSKTAIVSTFGDDICISTPLAEAMVRALSFFGFTVNVDKTFIDGPFRESCGYDYFNGQNVTPIYFKDIHDGKKSIETIYTLLNRIRKMAYHFNNSCGCDKRFRSIWKGVLKRIPLDLQFYGNEEYGDDVILTNYQGYRKYFLTRKARRVRPSDDDPHLVLSCALYGIPSNGISFRGASYTLGRCSGP